MILRLVPALYQDGRILVSVEVWPIPDAPTGFLRLACHRLAVVGFDFL